ncbi:MAG: hypothetical protein IJD28_02520 [Deferribacterales bacterium]|nr:hypothetical protein [Deferribacterales bacterium]
MVIFIFYTLKWCDDRQGHYSHILHQKGQDAFDTPLWLVIISHYCTERHGVMGTRNHNHYEKYRISPTKSKEK